MFDCRANQVLINMTPCFSPAPHAASTTMRTAAALFVWAVAAKGACAQCVSSIYCQGAILDAVQMSGIFKDSKTFVDMPTMLPEAQVLASFNSLPKNASQTQLREFVERNFYPPGYELQPAVPADWTLRPRFLDRIGDEKLRAFGTHMHGLWRVLTRHYDPDRLCKGCVSSLMRTPFPFVIPGGRFRESYYWDSYWIIQGLLVSEMFETAKGMIANLLETVQQLGFIPNGSRIYYLNRSQPPYLAWMVHKYLAATGDADFVRSSLPILDREYMFWMQRRTRTVAVGGREHVLNVYRADAQSPRPEAYRQDAAAAMLLEPDRRAGFYSSVVSAAESGWDFSSRWVPQPGNFSSINTADIVPVNLNSLLFRVEGLLLEMHSKYGSSDMVQMYTRALSDRQEAINAVFWDSQSMIWCDYNAERGERNTGRFYISGIAPLFHGISPPGVRPEAIIERYAPVLFGHPGGVPASDYESQEQWDFPNAWPPHQQAVTEYLLRNNNRRLALDVAQRFVGAAYCGWVRTGYVFEKYHSDRFGVAGGKGEYVVQEGFGWTNGVLLHLLSAFPDEVFAPKCPKVHASSNSRPRRRGRRGSEAQQRRR